MDDNAERFSADQLEGFQTARSEIARGEVGWTYPAFAFDDLEKLWDPDYQPPLYSLSEPDLYIGMTTQFRKDIQNVDRKLQGRILQAISRILEKPTTAHGDTVKPLSASMKGFWRYRLGDFRLIYFPELKEARVTLVSFMSRGEAYD